MGKRGINNIGITFFDLSPIKFFGKYSFMDVKIILRNMGEITETDPLEWKYRQGFYI